MQERDHRLPERHRLDREQPVPPGVELVDNDVGGLVALAGLVVVEALDDLQIHRKLLACGDHVLGSLPAAARRGVDDYGTCALARRLRRVLAKVDPGRDDLGVGHPADRIVGADDPGTCVPGPGELCGWLAADVGAEEVHDGLPPLRTQQRELQGFRDEREPEVEVEDVGVS